jgi:hypothetical protein
VRKDVGSARQQLNEDAGKVRDALKNWADYPDNDIAAKAIHRAFDSFAQHLDEYTAAVEDALKRK